MHLLKCIYVMYVQTLPDLRSSYILEDPVQVEFSASQNSVHMWSSVHTYPREPS